MNLKRYFFKVMRAGIFLTLFLGSNCPSPEQPVSNSSAEPTEAKSRIVVEKISWPEFSALSTDECLKQQQDAFSSNCISKKELADVVKLNVAPFCIQGELTELYYCYEKDPG